MKPKNQILKGMTLLFVLVVSTMGTMAQTSQSDEQTVCPGTEPYRVDVTTGNAYLWTVTGGTVGVDFTISSPNAASTDIIWANQAVVKTFTVTFRETVIATNCYEEQPLTVHVNPAPILVITNPAAVCAPGTVDLTAAAVTAGSTLPGTTTLSYWTDAAANIALASPNEVATSGTYYIKATISLTPACSDIKAVVVTINPETILVITNPAAICAPGTVDLTAAAVTAGSTLPGTTTLSYWTDAAATIALASPNAVATSGTYYIKATTSLTPACTDIKAVVVTINPETILVITNPAAICAPGTVDLTAAAVTAGSTLPGITTLSYWTDAAATIALASPNAIAASGTYYIKATTSLTPACSDIEAVNVTIYPMLTTSKIWHN